MLLTRAGEGFLQGSHCVVDGLIGYTALAHCPILTFLYGLLWRATPFSTIFAWGAAWVVWCIVQPEDDPGHAGKCHALLTGQDGGRLFHLFPHVHEPALGRGCHRVPLEDHRHGIERKLELETPSFRRDGYRAGLPGKIVFDLLAADLVV